MINNVIHETKLNKDGQHLRWLEYVLWNNDKISDFKWLNDVLTDRSVRGEGSCGEKLASLNWNKKNNRSFKRSKPGFEAEIEYIEKGWH